MEHWELEDGEARSVAGAAGDLMQHYNIQATAKTIDIIGFVVAFGTVYGARAILTMQELEKRRQGAMPPVDAPLVPNPGLNGAGPHPATIVGIGSIADAKAGDDSVPPQFRAPKQ